jgi:DNA polymerase I-like protein with 3'-5' exonuclease and polymerase domains
MTKYLTFDFETVDPYIGRKLGAGWVYGMNVPNHDFEVLGVSTLYSDWVDQRPAYGTEGLDQWERPVRYPRRSHQIVGDISDYTLVAHNAQYDLGCAHFLSWPVKDMPIYDTEVMARLHDSSLISYSLDNLASLYLGENKNNDLLVQAIKDHDLYPWLKSEQKKRTKTHWDIINPAYPDNKVKRVETWYEKPAVRDWSRHKEKALLDWAKSNMKIIQTVAPDVMAFYANKDVELTWKLFEFFKSKFDDDMMKRALFLSSMAHVCIDYRVRGVPVDLDAVRQAQRDIGPLADAKKAEIFAEAGYEFNINSSQEKGEVLTKRGATVPRQEEDPTKFSVTSKWMEKQDDKICALLIDYGKYNKIKRDTFDKLIEIQQYTVGPDAYKGSVGRVYPELNLLRARTGRFSSSGPNIQNIPKHHDVLGPMCRSLFIPFPGEKFYSLDYSNQEGRLQLHYAVLLKIQGAQEVLDHFRTDPRYDLHQHVATICGIMRNEGKTINLATSYGMGLPLLAQKLGCTKSQASAKKKLVNKKVPYVFGLSKTAEATMIHNGFIKTLGGRRLKREIGFEYKTFNKLIQGSASDQTIMAMRKAYDLGLPVLFPVHDELCMSSANPEDGIALQKCMVEAYELVVPTVVDIGEGRNWKECS